MIRDVYVYTMEWVVNMIYLNCVYLKGKEVTIILKNGKNEILAKEESELIIQLLQFSSD